MARSYTVPSSRKMKQDAEKDLLGRSVAVKKARKEAKARNLKMRRKFMKGN